MARIYFYIFAIWTLAWQISLTRGVKEGLSVGIAIDQGEPDTVIAQKTSDLLLNCSVTFNPDLGELQISWLKDSFPVDLSNKRIQLLENGSLYLRRVIHRPRKNRTDEGHYRCLARLVGVGQVIARDVSVRVAGIERKFDVEPDPQEAFVGGVARFQCQIQAVPPPIYIWEFNKNGLPQSDNRYFLLSSGILQITGVQESDAGLYRCYAAQGSVHELPGDVSDIDGKYSAEALLTVKPAGQSVDVRIVASSGNITAHVGSPATLECLVQGLKGPAEWRKDGKKITSNIDSRIKRIGNNLQFLETVIGDSGKYQCVAGRYAVETMTLTVIKKPVIVNGPESVEKVSSQWQYLDCETEGHPKPNVTWFKDGQRLDLEDASSNYRQGRFAHQLAIVQSEPHNSGYYQCFATNDAGSTSAIARIEINVRDDAPGSPKNVRVLNVTSTTILLAWDSPNNEPVLAYSVHYRKPDNRADDEVTKDSRIELIDLDPFSNYTISIGAYTSAGAGPKSRPIPVQTKESVPVKPVMVTLEPTASSIRVSWSEMPVEDRRGIITGYRLFYRPKDKPDSVQVKTSIPASARSYLLTDLLPETDYEVRMIAGTSAGFPSFTKPKWPWTHVKTELEDYVIMDPPQIQILPINSTAVNATWTLRGDLDIKQFILRLEQLPAQEIIKPVFLSSQDRYYVLYQLDESVRYELTLVVKSSDDSEAKVTKEFQTSDLPMVPRPTNLRVTLSTFTSLQVSWYQPTTELEIEHFTVRFMPLSGKKGVFSYRQSLTNSVLLKKLEENTVYNISVCAHSQKLRSLFSSSILAKTQQGGFSSFPLCDPAMTSCPTSTDAPKEGEPQDTNEQRLGIVIGVSIGVFCIVICIMIIVLRNRCLTPNYNQQPMTQPARFHGNGHIPGNGNGHAVSLQENHRSLGVEMDVHTPMLDRLPENEDSDSKGGGGGNVILTPNGAKLNGFVPMKKNGVRNGQNHNGHMVSFLPKQFDGETIDNEETRELLAAMMSGGNGQCLSGRMGEESFTTSRVDDLGSLDGIDHSSCEDMLRTSREHGCADERSGLGYPVGNRHSETQLSSLPQSVKITDSVTVDSSGLPRTVMCAVLGDQMSGNADKEHNTHSCSHGDIPHLVHDEVSCTSGTGEIGLCRNGTGSGSQESKIPHNQLSTSNKTQASGSESDPNIRGSSGSTPPPDTGVIVNGCVPADMGIRNRDAHRHCNGVSPHLVTHGGTGRPPQGVNRLVSAENNPSIPQSPLTRETTLSHDSRDITLDTLAQIPQDVASSAMVQSSPQKHHYQV